MKPLPLTPEQAQWFAALPRSPEYVNPCVRAFGKGPEGVKCKACRHLYWKVYAKVYIKCALRPNTNGPGTDHRANWAACGKFEPT